MPDIRISGMRPTTVAEIDRQARAKGLSRNEYLRDYLTTQFPPRRTSRLTLKDFEDSAHAAADLLDEKVMAEAWR